MRVAVEDVDVAGTGAIRVRGDGLGQRRVGDLGIDQQRLALAKLDSRLDHEGGVLGEAIFRDTVKPIGDGRPAPPEPKARRWPVVIRFFFFFFFFFFF